MDLRTSSVNLDEAAHHELASRDVCCLLIQILSFLVLKVLMHIFFNMLTSCLLK